MTNKKEYIRVLQISREESKEYGEYFKSMRKSINYSQEAMANELGVHSCTLRRWEKGQRIPHQEIDFIVECIQMVVKKVKSGVCA